MKKFTTFAVLLVAFLQATNCAPDASASAAEAVLRQYVSQGIAKRDTSARTFGYGGCNDAFSVFGFLAFLLALLDLIMDMMESNNNTGGGRKRRESMDFSNDTICSTEGLHEHEDVREATLAAYVMFRAFLNGLATQDESCAERFMCEGGYEAARLGLVGQAVASVAGTNAAVWLHRAKRFSPAKTETAIKSGATLDSCLSRYPRCSRENLPPLYSYPGIRRSGDEPEMKKMNTTVSGQAEYLKFVEEAMNSIERFDIK